MANGSGRAARVLRGLLALVLLTLWAGSRAAAPEKAASPGTGKVDPGFEWSVERGTQFNFGDLGIGLGSVLVGPYLDEKGVRRHGLHAGLDIAVVRQPSQFKQVEVTDGQTVEAAGYRILVEKIIQERRGIVILRVWGPPKPPKPPKHWWWPFSWLGRS